MASLAALDCGSNSTRLLIAVDGVTVVREMRITRLSEGVDSSGTLAEASIERTLHALRSFRDAMDRHHVTGGLLVATSAVRDARNGPAFLDRAQAVVGVPARLLAGHEEATFSFEGATASLPASDRPTMICDIGGGSTELAVPVDGDLVSVSMQLGCVRVTERALGVGVATAEATRRARDMITAELDRAFTTEPRLGAVVGACRLVGLAGTVATATQLVRGVATYDRAAVHHQRLTRAEIEWVYDELRGRTPNERLALPGMVPGREDVLCAGLLILLAVLDRFGLDELVSSEDDILDGVVRALQSTAPVADRA